MSFKINSSTVFKNLPYIGFFSLGAFISGILNYGLKLLTSIKDFQTFVAIVGSLAFAGGVYAFLQYLNEDKFTANDKQAIYMYPIGLVVSLLWLQVKNSITEFIIGGNSIILKVIGYSHLIFVSLITIYLIINMFNKNK